MSHVVFSIYHQTTELSSFKRPNRVMRVFDIVNHKQVKGYMCLAVVDATWIASGYLAQLIYTTFGFQDAISMAVYSVIIGLLLLMPLAWRRVSWNALPTIPQMGVLGLSWLFGQLIYLVSLMYTSMPTNTAISATATAFAFLFSMPIFRYDFRILSALGVSVSIAGIILTAFFTAESAAEDAGGSPVVNETVGGILLCLSGAVNSGVFTCLFKLWVKDDSNSGIVFGSFGIVGILVGIPVMAIAHVSGLQNFQVPEWDAALLIVCNGIICSVICNFFFSKTFIYLTPVIVQVGLTMTIPVSFVITAFVLHSHSYPTPAIVGVALISAAVVLVSYDQAAYEKVIEKQKGCKSDTKSDISEYHLAGPE